MDSLQILQRTRSMSDTPSELISNFALPYTTKQISRQSHLVAQGILLNFLHSLPDDI